ncbi:hypothetical protein ACNOYE_16930 [Nannocystaceae bacterium ST9]
MDERESPSPEIPASPDQGPRRSRSMAAAKALERARIMAMTERERIELAWELGRRCAALRAAQLAGDE